MIFQKTLKICLPILLSWLLATQVCSQPIEVTDSNKVLPVRKADLIRVLTGGYMAQYLQHQNDILLTEVDTLKQG
jgi:hypothetical protein